MKEKRNKREGRKRIRKGKERNKDRKEGMLEKGMKICDALCSSPTCFNRTQCEDKSAADRVATYHMQISNWNTIRSERGMNYESFLSYSHRDPTDTHLVLSMFVFICVHLCGGNVGTHFNRPHVFHTLLMVR
jgi:hypothetical protein